MSLLIGALMDYASRHELTGSFEDVCKTEEVVQFVLKELQQLSQSANLKGFKQVSSSKNYIFWFTLVHFTSIVHILTYQRLHIASTTDGDPIFILQCNYR